MVVKVQKILMESLHAYLAPRFLDSCNCHVHTSDRDCYLYAFKKAK